MYIMRKIMVTSAKPANYIYHLLESALVKLDPLWKRLGYQRSEKTIAFFEKNIKAFLFDCKMCGDCVLDKTGMSCPMNCPKQIRNGPCGGVRDNGNCEVKPEMRCVWIEAWRGAKKLTPDSRITPDLEILAPVNHRHKDRSSWFIKIREITDTSGDRNV
ncbi:MAG: methylenetetrahydrofolate reductase C-terminal domain-containing protein [Enterobacterales bacterium]|nr:methylenetetrahydrofolate reductase C-terminal domain-containing protein [Enterobacterales bacterium]